jgi:hypothetical protein
MLCLRCAFVCGCHSRNVLLSSAAPQPRALLCGVLTRPLVAVGGVKERDELVSVGGAPLRDDATLASVVSMLKALPDEPVVFVMYRAPARHLPGAGAGAATGARPPPPQPRPDEPPAREQVYEVTLTRSATGSFGISFEVRAAAATCMRARCWW